MVMLALMAAMAGTLGYGAHLGGRLVYEFGVGGEFGRSPQDQVLHPHESHEH
jgi:hypothetical protein